MRNLTQNEIEQIQGGELGYFGVFILMLTIDTALSFVPLACLLVIGGCVIWSLT